MKHIFTALAIVATILFSVPLQAQTSSQLSAMQAQVFGSSYKHLELQPVATAAHALVDGAHRPVWNMITGNAVVSNTTNAYTYTFSFATPTANRTISVPDGALSIPVTRSAATLTAGATPSFAPGATIHAYSLTPAENETIAGVTTGAVSGQKYTLIITTSGTTNYTITFGANFTSIGTLDTGTTTAIVYALDFEFDGTTFRELSRRRQGSPTATLTSASNVTALPSAEGLTFFTESITEATTINAAVVPRAGMEITLKLTNTAITSVNVTFGTGFSSVGVLASANSSTTGYTVTFVSDGTKYREKCRTAAQTL